ncbi:hypothetical protein DIPPA_05073 [Diplonema papillatum]|nr:hypothetical protein DIPPA_05073 [Diplonema papillatum]
MTPTYYPQGSGSSAPAFAPRPSEGKLAETLDALKQRLEAATSRHSEAINDLTKQLERKEKLTETLRSDRNAQQETIRTLSAQLERKATEVKGLKHEVDELSFKDVSVRSSISSFTATSARPMGSVREDSPESAQEPSESQSVTPDHQRSEIARAETRVKLAEAAAATAEEANEVLHAQLQALQAELTRAEQRAAEAEKQATEVSLRAAHEAIDREKEEQAIDTARATRQATLESKLASMQDRASQAEALVDGLKAKLADSLARLQAQTDEVASLEAKNRKLSSRAEALEGAQAVDLTRQKSLESDLTNAMNRSLKAESILASQKPRLEDLQAQLVEQSRRLMAVERERNTEVSRLQADLVSFQIVRTKLESQLAEARGRLEELTAQKSNFAARAAELEGQVAVAREAAGQKTHEASALQLELRQVSGDVAQRWERELESLAEQAQEANDRVFRVQAELESQTEAHDREASSLRSKLSRLQAALAASEANGETLEANVARLKEALSDSEDNLDAANTQLSRTKAELALKEEARDAELARLQHELSASEGKSAAANNQLSRLQSELSGKDDALVADLAQVKEALSLAKSRLQEAEARAVRAEATADELKLDIETVQQELASKLKEAESRALQAEKSADELNDEMQASQRELTGKLREAEARADQAEHSVEDLKREMDNLRRDLTRKLQEAETRVVQAEKTVEDLNGEMQTLQRELTGKLEDAAARAVQAENSVEDLNSEMDNLRRDLTGKLQEAETRVFQAEKSVEDLNGEMQSVQRELTGKLQEAEARAVKAENSVEDLNSEMDNLRRDLTGKLQEAETRVFQAEKSVEDLNGEMQSVKRELSGKLQEAEARAVKAENSVEDLNSEMDNLRRDLTGKLQEAETRVFQAEKSVEDLNGEMQSVQRELTGKLQEAEARAVKAENSVEDLNSEMDNLRRDLTGKLQEAETRVFQAEKSVEDLNGEMQSVKRELSGKLQEAEARAVKAENSVDDLSGEMETLRRELTGKLQEAEARASSWEAECAKASAEVQTQAAVADELRASTAREAALRSELEGVAGKLQEVEEKDAQRSAEAQAQAAVADELKAATDREAALRGELAGFAGKLREAEEKGAQISAAMQAQSAVADELEAATDREATLRGELADFAAKLREAEEKDAKTSAALQAQAAVADELKAATAREAGLRGELEAATERCREAEEKYAKMLAEIQSHELVASELEAATAREASLRSELESVVGKLRETEEVHTRLSAEVDAQVVVTDELNAATAREELLRDQLDDVTEKLRRAEEKYTKTSAEVKAHAAAADELKAATAREAALRDELEDVVGKLREAEEKDVKMAVEMQAQAFVADELKAATAREVTLRGELESVASSLRKAEEEAQSQPRGLPTEAAEEFEREIADLRRELAAGSEGTEQLRSALSKERAKISELEMELLENRTIPASPARQTDPALVLLEMRLSEVSDALVRAIAAKETAEDASAEKDAVLENLQAQLDMAEAKVQGEANKAESLGADLVDKSRSQKTASEGAGEEDKETKIQLLRSQLQSAEIKLKNETMKARSYEKKVDDMRSHLDAALGGVTPPVEEASPGTTPPSFPAITTELSILRNQLDALRETPTAREAATKEAAEAAEIAAKKSTTTEQSAQTAENDEEALIRSLNSQLATAQSLLHQAHGETSQDDDPSLAALQEENQRLQQVASDAEAALEKLKVDNQRLHLVLQAADRSAGITIEANDNLLKTVNSLREDKLELTTRSLEDSSELATEATRLREARVQALNEQLALEVGEKEVAESKLRALEKDNESLRQKQSAADELQERFQALSDQVALEVGEKEVAESKLRALENDNESLRQQQSAADELQERFQALSDQVALEVGEKEVAESKLRALENDNESLRQQQSAADELQERFQALSDQLALEVGEKEVAESKLRALENDNESLRQQQSAADELQERLQALSDQLAFETAEKAALEERLLAQTDSPTENEGMDELEARNRQLNDEKIALEVRLQAVEDDKQEAVGDLENRLQDAERALQEASVQGGDLSALSSQLEEAQARTNELAEQNATLAAELEARRSNEQQWIDAHHALEARMASLSEERAVLSERIAELTEQGADGDGGRVKDLEDRCRLLDSHLESAEDAKRSLEARLSASEQRARELQMAMDKVATHVDAQCTREDSFTTNKRALEDRLEEAEIMRQAAEDKCAELTTQLSKVKKSTGANVAHLTAQLIGTSQMAEELQEREAGWLAEKKELEETLTRTPLPAAAPATELSDARGTIAELQDQLAKKQEIIDKLFTGPAAELLLRSMNTECSLDLSEASFPRGKTDRLVSGSSDGADAVAALALERDALRVKATELSAALAEKKEEADRQKQIIDKLVQNMQPGEEAGAIAKLAAENKRLSAALEESMRELSEAREAFASGYSGSAGPKGLALPTSPFSESAATGPYPSQPEKSVVSLLSAKSPENQPSALLQPHSALLQARPVEQPISQMTMASHPDALTSAPPRSPTPSVASPQAFPTAMPSQVLALPQVLSPATVNTPQAFPTAPPSQMIMQPDKLSVATTPASPQAYATEMPSKPATSEESSRAELHEMNQALAAQLETVRQQLHQREQLLEKLASTSSAARSTEFASMRSGPSDVVITRQSTANVTVPQLRVPLPPYLGEKETILLEHSSAITEDLSSELQGRRHEISTADEGIERKRDIVSQLTSDLQNQGAVSPELAHRVQTELQSDLRAQVELLRSLESQISKRSEFLDRNAMHAPLSGSFESGCPPAPFPSRGVASPVSVRSPLDKSFPMSVASHHHRQQSTKPGDWRPRASILSLEIDDSTAELSKKTATEGRLREAMIALTSRGSSTGTPPGLDDLKQKVDEVGRMVEEKSRELSDVKSRMFSGSSYTFGSPVFEGQPDGGFENLDALRIAVTEAESDLQEVNDEAAIKQDRLSEAKLIIENLTAAHSAPLSPNRGERYLTANLVERQSELARKQSALQRKSTVLASLVTHHSVPVPAPFSWHSSTPVNAHDAAATELQGKLNDLTTAVTGTLRRASLHDEKLSKTLSVIQNLSDGGRSAAEKLRAVTDEIKDIDRELLQKRQQIVDLVATSSTYVQAAQLPRAERSSSVPGEREIEQWKEKVSEMEREFDACEAALRGRRVSIADAKSIVDRLSEGKITAEQALSARNKLLATDLRRVEDEKAGASSRRTSRTSLAFQEISAVASGGSHAQPSPGRRRSNASEQSGGSWGSFLDRWGSPTGIRGFTKDFTAADVQHATIALSDRISETKAEIAAADQKLSIAHELIGDMASSPKRRASTPAQVDSRIAELLDEGELLSRQIEAAATDASKQEEALNPFSWPMAAAKKNKARRASQPGGGLQSLRVENAELRAEIALMNRELAAAGRPSNEWSISLGKPDENRSGRFPGMSLTDEKSVRSSPSILLARKADRASDRSSSRSFLLKDGYKNTETDDTDMQMWAAEVTRLEQEVVIRDRLLDRKQAMLEGLIFDDVGKTRWERMEGGGEFAEEADALRVANEELTRECDRLGRDIAAKERQLERKQEMIESLVYATGVEVGVDKGANLETTMRELADTKRTLKEREAELSAKTEQLNRKQNMINRLRASGIVSNPSSPSRGADSDSDELHQLRDENRSLTQKLDELIQKLVAVSHQQVDPWAGQSASVASLKSELLQQYLPQRSVVTQQDQVPVAQLRSVHGDKWHQYLPEEAVVQLKSEHGKSRLEPMSVAQLRIAHGETWHQHVPEGAVVQLNSEHQMSWQATSVAQLRTIHGETWHQFVPEAAVVNLKSEHGVLRQEAVPVSQLKMVHGETWHQHVPEGAIVQLKSEHQKSWQATSVAQLKTVHGGAWHQFVPEAAVVSLKSEHVVLRQEAVPVSQLKMVHGETWHQQVPEGAIVQLKSEHQKSWQATSVAQLRTIHGEMWHQFVPEAAVVNLKSEHGVLRQEPVPVSQLKMVHGETWHQQVPEGAIVQLKSEHQKSWQATSVAQLRTSHGKMWHQFVPEAAVVSLKSEHGVLRQEPVPVSQLKMVHGETWHQQVPEGAIVQLKSEHQKSWQATSVAQLRTIHGEMWHQFVPEAAVVNLKSEHGVLRQEAVPVSQLKMVHGETWHQQVPEGAIVQLKSEHQKSWQATSVAQLRTIHGEMWHQFVPEAAVVNLKSEHGVLRQEAVPVSQLKMVHGETWHQQVPEGAIVQLKSEHQKSWQATSVAQLRTIHGEAWHQHVPEAAVVSLKSEHGKLRQEPVPVAQLKMVHGEKWHQHVPEEAVVQLSEHRGSWHGSVSVAELRTAHGDTWHQHVPDEAVVQLESEHGNLRQEPVSVAQLRSVHGEKWHQQVSEASRVHLGPQGETWRQYMSDADAARLEHVFGTPWQQFVSEESAAKLRSLQGDAWQQYISEKDFARLQSAAAPQLQSMHGSPWQQYVSNASVNPVKPHPSVQSTSFRDLQSWQQPPLPHVSKVSGREVWQRYVPEEAVTRLMSLHGESWHQHVPDDAVSRAKLRSMQAETWQRYVPEEAVVRLKSLHGELWHHYVPEPAIAQARLRSLQGDTWAKYTPVAQLKSVHGESWHRHIPDESVIRLQSQRAGSWKQPVPEQSVFQLKSAHGELWHQHLPEEVASRVKSLRSEAWSHQVPVAQLKSDHGASWYQHVPEDAVVQLSSKQTEAWRQDADLVSSLRGELSRKEELIENLVSLHASSQHDPASQGGAPWQSGGQSPRAMPQPFPSQMSWHHGSREAPFAFGSQASSVGLAPSSNDPINALNNELTLELQQLREDVDRMEKSLARKADLINQLGSPSNNNTYEETYAKISEDLKQDAADQRSQATSRESTNRRKQDLLESIVVTEALQSAPNAGQASQPTAAFPRDKMLSPLLSILSAPRGNDGTSRQTQRRVSFPSAILAMPSAVENADPLQSPVSVQPPSKASKRSAASVVSAPDGPSPSVSQTSIQERDSLVSQISEQKSKIAALEASLGDHSARIALHAAKSAPPPASGRLLSGHEHLKSEIKQLALRSYHATAQADRKNSVLLAYASSAADSSLAYEHATFDTFRAELEAADRLIAIKQKLLDEKSRLLSFPGSAADPAAVQEMDLALELQACADEEELFTRENERAEAQLEQWVSSGRMSARNSVAGGDDRGMEAEREVLDEKAKELERLDEQLTSVRGALSARVSIVSGASAPAERLSKARVKLLSRKEQLSRSKSLVNVYLGPHLSAHPYKSAPPPTFPAFMAQHLDLSSAHASLVASHLDQPAAPASSSAPPPSPSHTYNYASVRSEHGTRHPNSPQKSQVSDLYSAPSPRKETSEAWILSIVKEQKDDLAQQLSQAESQLAAKEHQLERKQELIDALADATSGMHDAASGAEVQSLRAKSRDLSVDLAHLSKQSSASKARAARHKSIADSVVDYVLQSPGSDPQGPLIAELRRQLNDLETQNDALQAELSSMRVIVSKHNGLAVSSPPSAAEARFLSGGRTETSRGTITAKESRAADGEAEELKKQLARERERNDALNSQILSVGGRSGGFDEVKKELEVEREKIAKLSTALSVQNDSAAASRELEAERSENARLRAALQQQQQQLQQQHHSPQHHSKALSSHGPFSSVTEYKDECSRHQEVAEVLQEQLTSAEKKKLTLKSQNRELQKRVSELESARKSSPGSVVPRATSGADPLEARAALFAARGRFAARDAGGKLVTCFNPKARGQPDLVFETTDSRFVSEGGTPVTMAEQVAFNIESVFGDLTSQKVALVPDASGVAGEVKQVAKSVCQLLSGAGERSVSPVRKKREATFWEHLAADDSRVDFYRDVAGGLCLRTGERLQVDDEGFPVFCSEGLVSVFPDFRCASPSGQDVLVTTQRARSDPARGSALGRKFHSVGLIADASTPVLYKDPFGYLCDASGAPQVRLESEHGKTSPVASSPMESHFLRKGTTPMSSMPGRSSVRQTDQLISDLDAFLSSRKNELTRVEPGSPYDELFLGSKGERPASEHRSRLAGGSERVSEFDQMQSHPPPQMGSAGSSRNPRSQVVEDHPSNRRSASTAHPARSVSPKVSSSRSKTSKPKRTPPPSAAAVHHHSSPAPRTHPTLAPSVSTARPENASYSPGSQRVARISESRSRDHDEHSDSSASSGSQTTPDHDKRAAKKELKRQKKREKKEKKREKKEKKRAVRASLARDEAAAAANASAQRSRADGAVFTRTPGILTPALHMHGHMSDVVQFADPLSNAHVGTGEVFLPVGETVELEMTELDGRLTLGDAETEDKRQLALAFLADFPQQRDAGRYSDDNTSSPSPLGKHVRKFIAAPGLQQPGHDDGQNSPSIAGMREGSVSKGKSNATLAIGPLLTVGGGSPVRQDYQGKRREWLYRYHIAELSERLATVSPERTRQLTYHTMPYDQVHTPRSPPRLTNHPSQSHVSRTSLPPDSYTTAPRPPDSYTTGPPQPGSYTTVPPPPDSYTTAAPRAPSQHGDSYYSALPAGPGSRAFMASDFTGRDPPMNSPRTQMSSASLYQKDQSYPRNTPDAVWDLGRGDAVEYDTFGNAVGRKSEERSSRRRSKSTEDRPEEKKKRRKSGSPKKEKKPSPRKKDDLLAAAPPAKRGEYLSAALPQKPKRKSQLRSAPMNAAAGYGRSASGEASSGYSSTVPSQMGGAPPSQSGRQPTPVELIRLKRPSPLQSSSERNVSPTRLYPSAGGVPSASQKGHRSAHSGVGKPEASQGSGYRDYAKLSSSSRADSDSVASSSQSSSKPSSSSSTTSTDAVPRHLHLSTAKSSQPAHSLRQMPSGGSAKDYWSKPSSLPHAAANPAFVYHSDEFSSTQQGRLSDTVKQQRAHAQAHYALHEFQHGGTGNPVALTAPAPAHPTQEVTIGVHVHPSPTRRRPEVADWQTTVNETGAIQLDEFV